MCIRDRIMGRRTVSLDDGSLRFRYFGKFQCGIAVFYYFLCSFAVFGPSLRPPSFTDVLYTFSCYKFRQVCVWTSNEEHYLWRRTFSNLRSIFVWLSHTPYLHLSKNAVSTYAYIPSKRHNKNTVSENLNKAKALILKVQATTLNCINYCQKPETHGSEVNLSINYYTLLKSRKQGQLLWEELLYVECIF